MTESTLTHTPSWLAALSQTELEQQLTDSPYDIYARLRRDNPIVKVPQMGDVWFVTRYDDVKQVGSDATFHGASDLAHMTLFGEGNVLSAEGDPHREQRAFIDPQLRKRKVATYIDDLVRPYARQLLAQLGPKGSAEIVTEYFEPVSVRALGDLLGLESVDSPTLQKWFHGLSQALVNKSIDESGQLVNKAAFEEADRIKEEIRQTVLPIIDRVTAQPDDTSLSHWVHDATDGTPRSADVLWPTLYVVLLGAMQEPGHGAANSLLGLLRNPDQLERVRADRALLPQAIEEGLRWIAPIGIFTRRATAPTQVAGQAIEVGDIVFCSMGSANRDETRWDNPDAFDIDRAAQPHLAFSAGAHTCAGSHFGKAVERIALDELLTTFPDLREQTGEQAVTSGWFFRAVRSLPVAW
ncbi:cytochrome P450 [Flexivirga meconopsidis]|uniref:cytochrome P450 n=1 Tax=Flexivirga meconopsidis TaxID=2977121 RepID=UPI002240A940|nr:cytochrome P450 [Flexivirga meconopsidis]